MKFIKIQKVLTKVLQYQVESTWNHIDFASTANFYT